MSYPIHVAVRSKLLAVLSAILLSSCASLASKPAEDVTDLSHLSLKKGQVLSIVAPLPKVGGEAALDAYYKKLFPIAERLGFERNLQFSVDATIVGKFKPSGIIFFSWPDAAAEKSLYAREDWPAIKATRPAAWEELRIYNTELAEDLNLTFDPDKYYTLAMAWLHAENADDYQKYLAGIEPALNQVGGRFIYKMIDPRSESNDPDFEGPDQLTFVEWDDADGFTKLSSTDLYHEFAPYFTSSVAMFEFLGMTIPSNR